MNIAQGAANCPSSSSSASFTTFVSDGVVTTRSVGDSDVRLELCEKVASSGEMVEGYVVRLEDGKMVKVKTKWWKNRKYFVYKRWFSVTQREAECKRRDRRVQRMAVQELRAVVKGWAGAVSPGKVFSVVPGAKKVEAFYNRNNGRRTAVVVSFQSVKEKAVAVEEVRKVGGEVYLEQAYSARSSGNAHR